MHTVIEPKNVRLVSLISEDGYRVSAFVGKIPADKQKLIPRDTNLVVEFVSALKRNDKRVPGIVALKCHYITEKVLSTCMLL
ncbi:MAG: hypothetical protein QM613_06535 [Micrococcaceae bacterium]